MLEIRIAATSHSRIPSHPLGDLVSVLNYSPFSTTKAFIWLCSLPSPVLSDSHIPVSLPSSSSPIHLLWQREQGGSKSSPLAQPSGNTVWLFQEWARVTASTSSPAKPLPAPGLSTSLPSAENSAGDSAILWLIFSISDWLNKIWRMISFHWATATEGWKCCEAGSLCERQHLSPRLKTWMCVIK